MPGWQPRLQPSPSAASPTSLCAVCRDDLSRKRRQLRLLQALLEGLLLGLQARLHYARLHYGLTGSLRVRARRRPPSPPLQWTRAASAPRCAGLAQGQCATATGVGPRRVKHPGHGCTRGPLLLHLAAWTPSLPRRSNGTPPGPPPPLQPLLELLLASWLRAVFNDTTARGPPLLLPRGARALRPQGYSPRPLAASISTRHLCVFNPSNEQRLANYLATAAAQSAG